MQLTVAAALALAMPAWAGMYTKSSPVLQLDAKSFDKFIRKTNYTSVSYSLEIYVNGLIQTCPFRLSNSMPPGVATARTSSPPMKRQLATSTA